MRAEALRHRISQRPRCRVRSGGGRVLGRPRHPITQIGPAAFCTSPMVIISREDHVDWVAHKVDDGLQVLWTLQAAPGEPNRKIRLACARSEHDVNATEVFVPMLGGGRCCCQCPQRRRTAQQREELCRERPARLVVRHNLNAEWTIDSAPAAATHTLVAMRAAGDAAARGATLECTAATGCDPERLVYRGRVAAET